MSNTTMTKKEQLERSKNGNNIPDVDGGISKEYRQRVKKPTTFIKEDKDKAWKYQVEQQHQTLKYYLILVIKGI